jgi:uncharacterized protein
MTDFDEGAVLCSSRYNFWIPLTGGGILYNARTGVSKRLSGKDTSTIASLLCGSTKEIHGEVFPDTFVAALRRGGFLVKNTFDELADIRTRFQEARGQTPMVLTLTTTQDCNLGCYYCYETRSNDSLQTSNISVIADWVRQRLVQSGKDSLHVDWYGGEPLLNIKFVEEASSVLQNLCSDLNVTYSASIISNGTCWPTDLSLFVRKHRIRQVQISFDGLKNHHDKRRRYRKGWAPAQYSSSFEQAVAVVDELLHVVRVDVRFNTDRGNQTDLEPFIEFCRSRGWFDKPFPCIFQLARISDYSERSEFMSQAKISEDEFEKVRERARLLVPAESSLDETTARSTAPLPRTSVCAALAHDSIVIGADGSYYRCGLQVGEKKRAVEFRNSHGDAERGADADWWDKFDPTLQPNCSRCSFLPVCWGGCPKKHLEGDQNSLDEQSVYWRKALPQKIAWQFGIELPREFSFSVQEQFR